VPTKPLPGVIVVNNTSPISCNSQTTTTKAGGSCDSIATAFNISSATLYQINPSLRDCSNIGAGQTLCLPAPCSDIYTVKSNDTCIAIGVDQGTSWQKIIAWNAGLDSRCSNIVGAKPSWGSTICVSPPGGRLAASSPSSSTPGNGKSGGQGGSGDGYADRKVAPPKSGSVAVNTTSQCGQYYQAKSGDDCAAVVARETVPMDMFIKANPSLVSSLLCTLKLSPGSWYCIHPLRFSLQGST
jgi:LysM repeat protein